MGLWKDTNNVIHDDDEGRALSLPIWPQGMTQITQAEANAILAAKVQPTPLKQSAQTALDKVTGSSGTIMRCVAAGVVVPAEWSAYVFALRMIANGSDTISTTLPTQPNYPAGT